MKTICCMFAVLLLAYIYDDVHALRKHFAPEPVATMGAPDDAATHPQPAHKPDAR